MVFNLFNSNKTNKNLLLIYVLPFYKKNKPCPYVSCFKLIYYKIIHRHEEIRK